MISGRRFVFSDGDGAPESNIISLFKPLYIELLIKNEKSIADKVKSHTGLTCPMWDDEPAGNVG
jgi:hypothetical protein